MAQISNAMPQAVLRGVDDKSARAIPYESSPLAIHIPHVFSYAQWGPTEPMMVTGGSTTNVYGSETFAARGVYATHQWPLINILLNRGNPMIFQRIQPEDAAPPATIGLYLDILQTDVAQYERNDDGSFKYDTDGALIPTGDTVAGVEMQWVIGPVADGKMGLAKKDTGTLTSKDGATSTIYPIREFQCSFFGEDGNNRGLALWAPTMESDNPVNSRVVTDQLAQLYRLRFVKRDNTRTTGKTVRTNSGAEYVDFSFRDDVVDSKTGEEFGFESIVLDSYRSMNPTSGESKRWGPFNSSYAYDDNLQEVLEMLYSVEQPVNDDIDEGWDAKAVHLMNFVTGVHYTGTPYYAIKVNGPNEGASALTETAVYYAGGGSDGTMSKELFDTAVGHICEDYGEGEWGLGNVLHFPVSHIYDTGFNLENKIKLLSVLTARKDISVVLSTQDVGLEQNSQDQESSMAMLLKTQAALHPESEYFGTPVMRASIIGQSGYLLNSSYRTLTPLTIELADKISAYAGNANGFLANSKAIDVNPNNIVNLFRDVNCRYKDASVRNADWVNGLVWVESYDQSDALFFPAYQTAYSDDTSVLNSIVTSMICGELEKVCVRAWSRLTGRSDLTDDQFAQRSDELIRDMTERRFDNRVVVVPETFYTTLDDVRGFSWSCTIKLYANNMKTVGTFSIESHRREELSE